MTLFKHTNPWEGEVEHVYDGPDPLLDHGACFVPVEPCEQCGGPIVTIRGRFPGTLDRTVCPTCLVETFESLITNEPSAGIGGGDE